LPGLHFSCKLEFFSGRRPLCHPVFSGRVRAIPQLQVIREGSKSEADGTENIWLVDVINQKLVNKSTDIRYLTLSHVWGNVEHLHLTKANCVALMIEGALAPSKVRIPRTIQDAMHVVKSLGETYQWVDSLCIMQDDLEERNKSISLMSTIYEKLAFALSQQQEKMPTLACLEVNIN